MGLLFLAECDLLGQFSGYFSYAGVFESDGPTFACEVDTRWIVLQGLDVLGQHVLLANQISGQAFIIGVKIEGDRVFIVFRSCSVRIKGNLDLAELILDVLLFSG